MKSFIFDNLISSENLCNLEKEKKKIWDGINKKNKLVIYGRRNTGKTSLLKNIIIPDFKKKHKESFVLFCDLMQVKDKESLSIRIQADFAKSFKESFPIKSLIERANDLIKGFRPVINFDPVTGIPNFEISTTANNKIINFMDIFEMINTQIAKKMPVLIVLDEFQDICFIDEAEGLFRKALQEFSNTPIVLMGSKKHLLYNMFSKPKAPFADFGTDIEFDYIPYKEYHEYIVERFKKNKISISFDVCKAWQDLLFRSPEPINMVGAEILNTFNNIEIDEKIILKTILEITDNRRGRFEELLSRITPSEEKVLIMIARTGHVKEPTGKEFLKQALVSASGIRKAIKKLEDYSFLEKTKEGYFFTNPFLYYYLHNYR